MASTAMPSASADLVTTWAFLEEGVNHIMSRLETGVSYSKYMSLYTVAYNYCTNSNKGGLGFDGSRPAFGSRTGASLVGSDLYNNLIRYLAVHLGTLRSQTETLQDVELLRKYAKEWERYTTGANYINRLFTYLNRHWVKRERDEGRKTIYPVYTLALAQWRTNLFAPVQAKEAKLVAAILRMIEAQRNGSQIDQTLVKQVVDSLVSLGLDDNDLDKACMHVYREHFELPFLETTAAYYTKESEAFLATNSVSEYMKKAEERLKEEEDRVDRYLNTTTRKELIAKCEDVLITRHSETFVDSFQEFLDYDKEADLKRMHGLMSRIKDGLEPLRKKFEEHVKRSGLEAIAKLAQSADSSDLMDPKAYVDALLEVHQKNALVVSNCFRGETGFVASLDKACQDFVNKNMATGGSNQKSPEFLAKHTDLLLRKNNKLAEDNDLEGALSRVMILFKYIEDKDVFQTFYTTKLSKRLIHGVSASDESEASMISKLKEACGFEYTNRLQRMFTDMSLSKDLTDQYKERMSQSNDGHDITFSIMVLGTNFWPLTPPSHEFLIPTDILPTFNSFTNYYSVKHSGRKLTWLWNYSKNELRTNYTKEKYVFMTSAYQMAVLVQYNKHDTMDLKELIAATGVPRELLLQLLAILVKAKVLINDEDEQYDLNPGFKSKKVRVNLNQPIKVEQKAETKEVLKAVDEDRKYVIQATIVRIMKSRKTMKNQALIQEVIQQISQRFTPKIPDIKKAIETLLEKEYIERVEASKELFAYVA